MSQDHDKQFQEKRIACLAFSDRGFQLAREIAEDLGAQAWRSGAPLSVNEWTRAYFDQEDALIYVGAAGIAVRAIAPFVKDKTTDPAVVVIDERAMHVIPLLSGHLGGANDLARRISSLTGSDCVITTATDVNGVFAVDEWSKHQDCALLEPEKIMHISGTLLAGGRVSVYSPWPISGKPPEGVDMIPAEIDPYAYDAEEEQQLEAMLEEYESENGTNDAEDDPIADEAGADETGADAFGDEDTGTEELDVSEIDTGDIDTNDIDISLDIEVVGRHPLHLVPRICVLGVGCRRGTSAQAIEEKLFDILELTCVHPAAICAVATIDLKKEEEGLLGFCEEHGWPLLTYSSEQLQEAEGDFTSSTFVTSITGVDNVCERSAVLASGGELIQKKISGGGVTMAMAVKPYKPDWEWQYNE